MLRTNSDAKQRVFDPTTRLLHWLTYDLGASASPFAENAF